MEWPVVTNEIRGRVVSARQNQQSTTLNTRWMFGVLLDDVIKGHRQWIVETDDARTISTLWDAYRFDEPAPIDSSWLVDPLMNAVDDLSES